MASQTERRITQPRLKITGLKIHGIIRSKCSGLEMEMEMEIEKSRCDRGELTTAGMIPQETMKL